MVLEPQKVVDSAVSSQAEAPSQPSATQQHSARDLAVKTAADLLDGYEYSYLQDAGNDKFLYRVHQDATIDGVHQIALSSIEKPEDPDWPTERLTGNVFLAITDPNSLQVVSKEVGMDGQFLWGISGTGYGPKGFLDFGPVGKENANQVLDAIKTAYAACH